jgi:hypothetical protein
VEGGYGLIGLRGDLSNSLCCPGSLEGWASCLVCLLAWRIGWGKCVGWGQYWGLADLLSDVTRGCGHPMGWVLLHKASIMVIQCSLWRDVTMVCTVCACMQLPQDAFRSVREGVLDGLPLPTVSGSLNVRASCVCVGLEQTWVQTWFALLLACKPYTVPMSKLLIKQLSLSSSRLACSLP